MNDRITGLLEHSNIPRSVAEIVDMLEADAGEISRTLIELAEQGKVVTTKKGKYTVPRKMNLIACRVSMNHSGAPIARPIEGGMGYRMKEDKLHSMPDDIVLVKATGEDKCELVSVCRRGHNTIPVFVRVEQKRKPARGMRDPERVRYTAVSCDPRITCAICLTGDTSFLKNNEIVLIEIEDYPVDKRPLYGHAVRVLGPAASMLSALRANAENHGFSTVFPESVETEIRGIVRGFKSVPSDKRVDLRDEMIFTIDGADSKDFDDAVSVRIVDDHWQLGVHIADVSHFVRPGSETDREAYARGTSLYLPGCTVPMLPEELSNDLCSLMPNKDRMAMSLIMEVSRDGKVIDHNLTRSVIRSKARLTYAGVNRFFEDGEGDIDPDVGEALNIMRELAGILQKRAGERGSVDFDMEEVKFVLNEKYEPVDILPVERGISERLIESFMLLANETVARLAKDTMTPFVYRIHEEPDPDRVAEIENYLKLNGTPVHLGKTPHPRQLRDILIAHEEDPALNVLRTTMLHAMKKARYNERPVGHYALSLEDYCHFTSPIRRYPDLMVHRMLKLLLDGENTGMWEGRMSEISNTCSHREQESVRAEREADSMMKAAYMKKQIGRKFDGVISGVTAWGTYVELTNGIEGLVHIADMDEYFDYNREKGILKSIESGKELRVGMPVRVRVSSADVARGEVNFEFTRSRR